MDQFTCGACLVPVTRASRRSDDRPLLCGDCYSFDRDILALLQVGCQKRYTVRGVFTSPAGCCACGEPLDGSAYAMRSPTHLAQSAAALAQRGLIPREAVTTATELMVTGQFDTLQRLVVAVQDIHGWIPPRWKPDHG